MHFDVTVSDICDPNPFVELLDIVPSEPDDGPGGADGRTTGDIASADYGTPDFDVQLRAERAGILEDPTRMPDIVGAAPEAHTDELLPEI